MCKERPGGPAWTTEAIVADLILETLEEVVALVVVSVQVVALAVAKALGGSMNLGAQAVLLERNKKYWLKDCTSGTEALLAFSCGNMITIPYWTMLFPM